MELEEILAKINQKPTEIWKDIFGEVYEFEFPNRQHFNVNDLIIRCDKLHVSNTGLEFHFNNGTGGRFVHTDNLKSIKYFYHYF